MAPLTKLYFTGAEKDQLLATAEQDYPSLQLSATQVQDDEWFLIVRIDGQFVATISSPLQFEALVAAAFAIVGDVMPQERADERIPFEPVQVADCSPVHLCTCGLTTTFLAGRSLGNGQYSTTPLCIDHVDAF